MTRLASRVAGWAADAVADLDWSAGGVEWARLGGGTGFAVVTVMGCCDFWEVEGGG